MQTFQKMLTDLVAPIRAYMDKNALVAKQGDELDYSLDTITKSMLWMKSWFKDTELTKQKFALGNSLLSEIDKVNIEDINSHHVLRVRVNLHEKIVKIRSIVCNIQESEKDLLKAHNQAKPASFDRLLAILDDMMGWMSNERVLQTISIATAYEVFYANHQAGFADMGFNNSIQPCLPDTQKLLTRLLAALVELKLDKVKSVHIPGYERKVPHDLARSCRAYIINCVLALHESNEKNFSDDFRRKQFCAFVDALANNLEREEEMDRGILSYIKGFRANPLISELISDLTTMSCQMKYEINMSNKNEKSKIKA